MFKSRLFCLLVAISWALAAVGLVGPSALGDDKLVQTLTIEEVFGVAHPEQIIDFDLKQPVDAKNCRLVDDQGQEAAYQLIDGGNKLALLTDLPAGAVKSWKLLAGQPPLAQGDIEIREQPGYFEITNGLTGVRIFHGKPEEGRTPGPIQGLRLRSGNWTGTGGSYLRTPSKSTLQRVKEGLDWPYEKALGHQFGDVEAKSIRTEFLERGSLKTVVRVTYLLARPKQAAYRCTIEFLAGQPSLLVTEEARNVELTYELGLEENLAPDTARFRGIDPQRAGLGDETEAALAGDVALRTFVWDAWTNDGGVQVSAFRAADDVAGDLLGTFPGPTSRARGARAAGTFLMCQDSRVFLRMQLYHSLPKPAAPFRHNRYAWGIFMGQRGDVKPPDAIQPIDLERNRLAGINLNKIHRLSFDIPEPAGKFGSLYIPRAAVDKLIARIHADPDYRNFIYDAEPGFRPLLLLLDDPALHADPGGERMHKAAASITEKARETLRILVHEHGTEDKRVHNYEGVFKVINDFYLADQVLASPDASAEDKAQAARAIVLFAAIWSDDDHAPFQPDTHLNYGSENMPLTYLSFRDMFILYLARHPQFKHHLDDIVERTRRNLASQINEHGAHMGSMHYVEASFSALVNTMLQLKQAGVYDFFQNDGENGHRLTKFAEFVVASMTPWEPRYGVRKFISTGDSACESSDSYGVLGTAFAGSNAKLSRRLMGAWRQNGKRHQSMFGSSVLKIDDTLPDAEPEMGSIDIPGYYSIFRAGWGTPQETALWFINGDWYRDHKHAGDGGEIILYALGAPLSLDPGSMYSPRLALAEHHSVVHGGGASPRERTFTKLANGGYATTTFNLQPEQETGTEWKRAVSLAMLADDQPVIAVQDTFSRDAERTCQFNLMSQGTAEVTRLTDEIERISVKGQAWPLHPTQGIDWDIFVISTVPRQIDWSELSHQWNPVVEMNEFAQANGRDFEETQQVLRLTGRGSFRTFIVPYLKGQKPDDLSASLTDGTVTVTAAGKIVIFRLVGSFDK
ncbi:MAG: hypothetical protein AB7O62_21150 [Pirellulales bacterium]